MKQKFVLSQEDFDNLLRWLSPDREEAGEIYEKIRDGLLRFFRYRGCSDPEALADETINRVAAKVSTFDSEGKVKTITYFYGFAANIYREYISNRSNKEFQLEESLYINTESPAHLNDLDEVRLDCLEICLGKLTSDESELAVKYYSRTKKEKIGLRLELAKKMQLTVNALYLKVHRLKLLLRECVEKCQKEKAT